MQFSINRFVQYLLDRQKEINELLLKLESSNYPEYIYYLSASDTELNTISNFLRIFSVEEENWCSYRELFGDFDILSLYLIKAGLNDADKTNIVFYLIKKNIAAGITDKNCFVIDPDNIKDYTFDEYTTNEVEELFAKVGFEQLGRDARGKFLKEISANAFKIQNLHGIINKHYFQKRDNFDEEDINKVLLALLSLSVDMRIIKSIDRNLKKQKQKQDAKKQSSSKLNFVGPEEQCLVREDKKLSNKEYKVVLKELRNYVDVELNKPVRILNFEEIIFAISLMLKISVDEESIAEFCVKLEKENKKKMHPVVLYTNLYRKICYYIDKGYDININEINSYINELFIVNDDDYEFWLDEVKSEILKIYDVLPRDYQFEIEEAKKLLKAKM